MTKRHTEHYQLRDAKGMLIATQRGHSAEDAVRRALQANPKLTRDVIATVERVNLI